MPETKQNRSGAATRTKIVEAAIAVLSEKGYAGFTMQAVADGAGVFYGNVTHHYPTRDKLIDAMLEAILEGYRARFDDLIASLEACKDGPIRPLVTLLIDDAVSKQTGRLFPQLWALAAHLPHVAEGARCRSGQGKRAASARGVVPARDRDRRHIVHLLQSRSHTAALRWMAAHGHRCSGAAARSATRGSQARRGFVAGGLSFNRSASVGDACEVVLAERDGND